MNSLLKVSLIISLKVKVSLSSISILCYLIRNDNEMVVKQTLTQRSNLTRFYAGGVGSEYSTAIYAELYNGSDSAVGGGGGGV